MNSNLCGKQIKMTYGGVTKYATILDTVRFAIPKFLIFIEDLHIRS